jgi:hypothetical protein
MHGATEQVLIEVPVSSNGFEVLRAVQVRGVGYRILSVPIFLRNLSRGTVVEAAPTYRRPRLRIWRVRVASRGATIRAIVRPETMPRRVCDDHLVGAIGRRLGLGPFSLLEPDTVAVHISSRRDLPAVEHFFRGLEGLGVLHSYEVIDPAGARGIEVEPVRGVWEIVHPPETAMEEQAPST